MRHRNRRGKDRRECADERHDRHGLRVEADEREHAHDRVHTRRHHRRGMDHRADGSRAFHRVRQPDVQRELRGFADGSDEEQQTDQACSRKPRKPLGTDASVCRYFFGEDLTERKCPGRGIKISNAQQHEHIADACGHECLDRCIARRWFCVPETDQQVRAQAHDLPADEEGQQVIRENEHIHAKGEQAEEGKEPRIHRLDRWQHAQLLVCPCSSTVAP